MEKATQKQTPVAVEGYNYGPVWSDDGDEVAWLRFTQGRTEVWVHSVITGGERWSYAVDGGRWVPTPDPRRVDLALAGLPVPAARGASPCQS